MLGICLGMQLAFDSSEELGGAEGLGHRPRRGARAAQPGELKLPHIGWNEVALREPRARRCSPTCRERCAFYHVHSLRARPAERAGRARDRRVRRAVRHGRASAAPSTASSSTPRSPPPPGCACSATSPASAPARRRPARGARPAVKLYPAIDILDGSAVRLVKGDFDASTVYDEDPLSAARGWVQRRAPSACTSSTSTAPAAGAPVNLEQLRRIAAETGVPVQYGGGLRSAAGDRARARGRRRARGHRHRRVHRPRAARARRSPSTARSGSLVGVDVRGGLVATHGWIADQRAPGPRRLRGRCASAACAASSSPTSTATACSTAPNREEVAEVAARGGGRRADLLGRDRLARGPARPRRAARRARPRGLEGVIVGKALYERRFTIAQAAGARRLTWPAPDRLRLGACTTSA